MAALAHDIAVVSVVTVDGAWRGFNADGDRTHARAHGVTEAQVILRWHIENGTIIIPKSVHVRTGSGRISTCSVSCLTRTSMRPSTRWMGRHAGHDPMTFTYA